MKRELRVADWTIGGNSLGYILGINVLEDEGLALETAAELKSVTGALGKKFLFKASFDKANRSSAFSYRGPGLLEGLRILGKVKEKLGLPLITDVHEPSQCEPVAAVVDVLQIPAFLCRQSDLVVAAAKAVEKTGGLLHIKKGQFLAPWDCRNILFKVKEAAPSRDLTILCERGVSFGYNNLVVDFLGLTEMQAMGAPVSMDATHAVQLPGAGKGVGGENSATGGRRAGVQTLALAAVAAGVDAVFLEFHPQPENAKCDGPSCLPLASASALLKKLEAVRAAIH